MKLKLIDEENEMMKVFKQASSSIADKHTLFRKATANVRDGNRFQTFDAYLKPALRRKNLHVLLKTQAISVSFN